MSRHISLLLLCAPITIVAAQTGADRCPAAGTSAELFGPEIPAADSGRIFSYSVSADGREFYFFKKVGEPRSEEYRIFRALRQGNGWSTPEQLRLGVDASDLYPSLSADGSRLVFSSYRPVPGDTSQHPNAHLYLSRRDGTGWSTPQLIVASRIGHYHSGVQQREDGTLTLRVTAPDWRSSADMELRWNGEVFERAMTVAAPKPAFEFWRARSGDSIYVWGTIDSPNGAALVSVSKVTQPGNRRAPAQYFVSLPQAGGTWSNLVPAGGGLGAGAPNFAWWSADGCWLHFTSDYSRLMRIAAAAVLQSTE
jgi:hypothetical protein